MIRAEKKVPATSEKRPEIAFLRSTFLLQLIRNQERSKKHICNSPNIGDNYKRSDVGERRDKAWRAP